MEGLLTGSEESTKQIYILEFTALSQITTFPIFHFNYDLN